MLSKPACCPWQIWPFLIFGSIVHNLRFIILSFSFFFLIPVPTYFVTRYCDINLSWFFFFLERLFLLKFFHGLFCMCLCLKFRCSPVLCALLFSLSAQSLGIICNHLCTDNYTFISSLGLSLDLWIHCLLDIIIWMFHNH